MNEKKIAKTNWLAERFGLPSNKEYILVRSHGSMWSVYDFNGHYITECRTDCFDNYRNLDVIDTVNAREFLNYIKSHLVENGGNVGSHEIKFEYLEKWLKEMEEQRQIKV